VALTPKEQKEFEELEYRDLLERSAASGGNNLAQEPVGRQGSFPPGGREPIPYNPGKEQSIQPAPDSIDQSTGLPRYRPDVDPNRAERGFRALLPGARFEGTPAYQGEQAYGSQRPPTQYAPERKWMPYAPGMDFPMAVGQMEDATQEDRVAARGMTDAGLRYGLPIAAGLASAPLALGMKAIQGGAFLSSIGAGSQLVGSTLAELMQQEVTGKPINKRETLSEAALAATPFKQSGSLISRGLFNLGANILGSEAGRFIQDEDYSLKSKSNSEAIARWAGPVLTGIGLSAMGSQGNKLAGAADKRAQLAASRMGGPITVTDIFPSASKLEGKMLERGSSKVRDALMNADVNISQAVTTAFPEIPNTSPLAADLAKHVGELSRLQKDYQSAKQVAELSLQSLDQARGASASGYPAMFAKAKEAALEASKRMLLYQEGVQIIFGGVAPELTSIAKGQRIFALREVGAAAKDAAKSAIGELYGKAGVGINTPVVWLDTVNEEIAKMGAPGMPLAGDVARNNVLKAIQKTFGKDTTLTLEQYRNMQSDIAAGLVKDGADVDSAKRIAAGAYAAVKSASDDFMAKSRPEIAEAWKIAQTAAASEFQARGTQAIDLIAAGKANELLQLIMDEGAGPVLKELNSYAAVIASTANRTSPNSIAASMQASQVFTDGVNKVLRDGLVDRAVDNARSLGFPRDFRGVDLEKLVGEMQTLASNGFPIDKLGLGSSKDIAALARTTASGKKGGYTVENLDEFFKDLPKVGADAAAARQAYQKAVDAQMWTTGEGHRKAVKEAGDVFAAAKLSADEVADRYNRAAANPLVQLLNNTDMKLSQDVVDNGKWIAQLMTVGPELAGEFITAMEKAGRGTDVTKIRTAATATVMRAFAPATDGPPRLNLEKIKEFFYGQNEGEKKASETLRKILNSDGGNAYENLVGRFASPIRDILSTRSLIQGGSVSDPTVFLNSVKARVQAAPGITAYTGIPQLLGMIESGRYNVLHTLYVNPRFAPKFSAAGYNVDKFVASNPVNATALKLAQDEDAAAKPAAPRQ
jgi:hypothetical protein